MTTQAHHWERLKRIFEEAVDLDPADRAGFLQRACGGDTRLRKRVRAMLAADASQGDFIEPPGQRWPGEKKPDPLIGQRVGAYHILERIGAGGMGQVYLAERADAQFELRVAIKVLRRGLETDALLARFSAERNTLAALRHEGIARLLDGGTLPDGRPYFVMEHVAGQPINEYCAAHRLGTRERLRLFLAVCDSVQHAHAQLVVHRDLKPANVLVTDDGTPKLLDFGVAKMLQDDSQKLTTVISGRPMTVEYASPEQVRGEHIGTASDVYSLGVILYELLTDRRLYRYETRAQLERAIQETDPEKPSTAVMTDPGEADPGRDSPRAGEAGVAPSEPPHGLRRALTGDLDNIVLMALRKEPDRRYASVEQLAEDIRRHHAGLPVISRPPVWTYRASKFVRRNALAVSGAIALVAMLLAGLIGMAWKAGEAREARREAENALVQAENARDQAEAVTAFLQEVLGAAEPGRLAGDVLLVDVLDNAAKLALERLEQRPLVEAAVRATLGQTYVALGRLEEAHRELQSALSLRESNLPEDDLMVSESVNDLGAVLYALGRRTEAMELFERALQQSILRDGEDSADSAQIRNNMAATLNALGQHERAHALHLEVLEARMKHFDEAPLAVAETLNNLGLTYSVAGEASRAEESLRESLRIRRLHLPPDHPLVAQSLSNLAAQLTRQRHLDEATPLFEEALEINRRILGPDHPDLATDLANLGTLRQFQGDLAQAAVHYEESLRIRRAVLPAGSFKIDQTEVILGRALLSTGRAEEAEPLLAPNLVVFREQLGANDRQTLKLVEALATLYEQTGRPDEAMPLRQWIQESAPPPDD